MSSPKQIDAQVQREAETLLPTKHGDFRLIAYSTGAGSAQPIALVKGEIGGGAVLVRVHSECFTGDVLGSKKCDCGDQLAAALEQIEKEGGVLVYLRQEGRGIGLLNKLRAYELQEGGLDTVEANHALGFGVDLRDYGVGAQILLDLGVRKIRLMTNNPEKIIGLEGYGLEVVERVPLEVAPHEANRDYLLTKQKKMGHLLGGL